MSVLMPLTLNLAVALGVYALAGSIGILLSPPERTARLFDEIANSPGLIFAYGVIAFAIGATWIMVHHDWITPLGIIISLAGWLITIEGVLFLAFPQVLVAFALKFKSNMKPWCLIGIVLGLLLIVAGLTGIADAPIIA